MGKVEATKKFALVIGHKEKSQGAANPKSGLTEWTFSKPLVNQIHYECMADSDSNGLITKVVHRDVSYSKLPDKINSLNPDYIILFHCNSAVKTIFTEGEIVYVPVGSGTEMLYYHKSKRGQKMAGILQSHVVKALDLPSRGLKPKTRKDRGGKVLRETSAPCVLAESFFINNDGDVKRAFKNYAELIQAYIAAMKEIIKEV